MLNINLLVDAKVSVFGRVLSSTSPTIAIDVAALFNKISIEKNGGEVGSSDFTDLCLLLDRGIVVAELNGVYYHTSTEIRELAQGSGGESDAVSIRGKVVSPTVPTTNQVLLFDGSIYVPSSLTMDVVGPAFVISTFVVTPSTREVGQSAATPAFTASYSSVPDATPGSVVLTDNQGSPSKDVSATPTAFTSNGTFTKSTYGATVTFTLTAKKGALTKTAGATISWLQKVYWGVGAAGGSTEAFIKALASSALATSKARTFTVTAGALEKIYYAFRKAYGTATFYVGGFEGGFNAPSTISVTNDYGFTEDYYLYESTNLGLGTTTVQAV